MIGAPSGWLEALVAEMNGLVAVLAQPGENADIRAHVQKEPHAPYYVRSADGDLLEGLSGAGLPHDHRDQDPRQGVTRGRGRVVQGRKSGVHLGVRNPPSPFPES